MPRSRLLALGVVAAMVLLAVAALVVVHPTPTGPERSIDSAMLAPRGSWDFSLFRAVTAAGSGAVVAGLGVMLAVACWVRGYRWLAVRCVVAPGVAAITEMAAKPVVGRHRPGTSVLTGESGFGFPSGHAAGATALACVVVLVAWRVMRTGPARTAVIAGASAYAAAVGISRLVVGAHDALDVVAGWLLGVAAAALVAVVIGVLEPVARSAVVQQAPTEVDA